MTIAHTYTALKTGLAAGSFLFLAHAGMADEITLNQTGGTLTLTGELVEFIDDTYIVDTGAGRLRIQADLFDCVGEGCPSLEATFETVAVWDVSLWGSRRAFTEHVERIAELVSEKTGGEFTLNISYGGLSPSRENLDGIAAGKFEMAQFCAGYHNEKNPTITVLELPFLGVESLDLEVELSFAVYEHPATIADMARWNATLLMPSPQPQNNIIGVGFPPTSLASFRGMKVRASGGVGRAIEALGGIPDTIPADAVQAALADGTVDAVAFAPHAHMAFKTIESGSWWTTNLNPGTSNCPVVVNTDALNSLSPANRVALLSSVDEAVAHYVDNYNNVTMAAWGPALNERQIVEITISDGILATINDEVAGPAAAAWIAQNAANGLPAQELYDLVTGIIADHN
jgi:TRAP-type mannitol/chloroaromatic compound transport system substrate-binding protein